MVNLEKHFIKKLRNISIYEYVGYCLLLSAVFISGVVLSVLIDGSIWNLNSFNTQWGDELTYYRTVLSMRTMGYPTGHRGYNECVPPLQSYGNYSVLTFIPYYLTSFITGISSHNFIVYGNVILIELSIIVFILAIRPTLWQSILFSLLFASNMVITRYIWSGMAEAFFIATTISVASISINLYRKKLWKTKEYTLLGIMLFLIYYMGATRPFMLAYILLPIMLLYRNSGLKKHQKTLLTIGIFLLSFATIYLFFWFIKNTNSKFLYDTILTDFKKSPIDAIINAHNNVLALILNIFSENLDAFTKYTTAYFCFFMILYIALSIYSIIRKKEYTSLVLATLIITFVIFEAIIIIYNYAQTRMYLSVAILMIIFATVEVKELKIAVPMFLITVFCMYCIIANMIEFPQNKEGDDVKALETRRTMTEVMPYDSSGEEFNNTIITPIYLPYTFDRTFMLPEYIGNTFLLNYDIIEKIKEGFTFKSKYMIVARQDELNELCAEKYENIWEDDYCIVYKLRD